METLPNMSWSPAVYPAFFGVFLLGNSDLFGWTAFKKCQKNTATFRAKFLAEIFKGWKFIVTLNGSQQGQVVKCHSAPSGVAVFPQVSEEVFFYRSWSPISCQGPTPSIDLYGNLYWKLPHLLRLMWLIFSTIFFSWLSEVCDALFKSWFLQCGSWKCCWSRFWLLL